MLYMQEQKVLWQLNESFGIWEGWRGVLHIMKFEHYMSKGSPFFSHLDFDFKVGMMTVLILMYM